MTAERPEVEAAALPHEGANAHPAHTIVNVGAGQAGGWAAQTLRSEVEIDQLGLHDLDRRVLRSIIEKFGGGPVGLDTIGASISEESDTIMDVVEPYLLQLGFLERTARGRVATPHAYRHLNLPLPQHVLAGKPNQPSLFNASGSDGDSDGVEE